MRGADAALDHTPFAIDEFEFGETQQEADMIETFACVALAVQLQNMDMMREAIEKRAGETRDAENAGFIP